VTDVSTTTVVVGAGHAGLAMSRCLTERSIDHVVLERGEVASSWRTERWDSLRLLTPNWQSRLPGFAYEGSEPDGFMSMPEVIAFLQGYAQRVAAPVRTNTTVSSIRRADDGYRVYTDQGVFACRAVVLATGACNVASVPKLAQGLPPSIAQLTPLQYRRPEQLERGGVLVVGASATGIQLAEELHRSGRPVTLAVGEHVRAPRTYRGKDIQWWMHRAGVLDLRYDEVDDLKRARGVPSPQLVGSTARPIVDLNTLSALGVKLVGRLSGVQGGKAQLSGSLRNVCALADLKMKRLLKLIDQWATEHGLDGAAGSPERFEPTRVPDSPALALDFGQGQIRSVLWATGYQPDYSYLHVPVLDAKGELRHDAGVVDSPGMYVMGLPFLRRRKSTFIHGAADDARDLSAHLASYLDGGAASVH
jgi:putative flavoprotein involved in K+ transport